MRRRLIVMRHAKSSWSSGAATDHARPLNARGRRDAPRVAQRLVDLGWVPEIVLSSDSQRTRETFDLMSEHFADSQILFTEALYLAGASDILSTVGSEGGEAETVMTLGHNPGCESLVRWLSGESAAMKTASAALFQTKGASWRGVLEKRDAWTLCEVIRPRELA